MRALSWAVVAGAFLAGLFLPDWVAKAAVPPPKDASGVSLESGNPFKDSLDPVRPTAATGAPGAALTPTADGKAVVHDPDVITPLNERDPTALVMTPYDPECARAIAAAEEPCACDEDSLHRYQPKKTRKKDLETLKVPRNTPRPSNDNSGLIPDPEQPAPAQP